MRNKTILIVTYNWPPRNAIGTNRPYSWAKYWAENEQVAVKVITAKKYAFDGPLDYKLPALKNVEVFEVPYIKVVRYLSFLMRYSWVRGLAKKIKKIVNKNKAEQIEVRNRWIEPALAMAKEIVKDVDFIVSSHGPSGCHIIAANLKKDNPEVIWVADYRDLWSQNHLLDYTEDQVERQRQLEVSTVGVFADHVTTVSRPLAEQLEALLRKPVSVITNGFDLLRSDIQDNIRRFFYQPVSKPVLIVYTGMIYPGYRDPIPLLEVISDMVEDNIILTDDVRVIFYGEKNDALKSIAGDKRFKKFVELKGHVSREVAYRAQSEADILLLLESSSPGASGVLTGKLFEYMAAGRPVLSIGSSSQSAICSVLQKTGCGICAHLDRDALKRIILELVSGRRVPWFNPDVDAIMGYSRHSQAEKMFNIFNNP